VNRFLSACAVVVVGSLSGCASTSHPLMPTPALYLNATSQTLFHALPAERMRPSVDLLYITDRSPQTDPQEGLPYGEERARSLAYGSAEVRLVPNLSWDELVRQSLVAKRSVPINLELAEVRELGRFPNEPYSLQRTPEGIVRSPEVMRRHRLVRRDFDAELSRRLATSTNADVMLYVHGFNETFATAAYTTAELCHFMGREHVCTLFTWPASSSGAFLTAYSRTTESADYAVAHLVKAIRMIAQNPDTRTIQLLAHSRGASVLLNALRELAITYVAVGLEPAEVLKLDNVVLMSPDIDIDIARQKIEIFGSDPDLFTHWSSERLPRLLRGRLTIYSSPDDRALLASTLLFRSRKRLGRLNVNDLSPDALDYFDKRGGIDLVVYRGKASDGLGHAYFASNPEVSADLIRLIRYGRAPGDPGRPLVPTGQASWAFP